MVLIKVDNTITGEITPTEIHENETYLQAVNRAMFEGKLPEMTGVEFMLSDLFGNDVKEKISDNKPLKIFIGPQSAIQGA